MNSEFGLAVLVKAALLNGLNPEGAEIIRNGSHLMCKLVDGIVGRVGERGSQETARREIQVSQWLTEQAFPVVQAFPRLVQPTVVDDYPVTWWRLLPEHRSATTKELGAVLRKLHDLPIPKNINLPELSPFTGISNRIASVSTLSPDESTWLAGKVDELRHAYAEISGTEPERLVHGDAWQGNVAVPTDGRPILLDLEAVCVGPSEWDLVSIAADYTDFSRISSYEYASFVDAYGGFDVTQLTEYRTLADIQELRWTSYVISKSRDNDDAAQESHHRIACLRGEIAPPWKWTAF